MGVLCGFLSFYWWFYGVLLVFIGGSKVFCLFFGGIEEFYGANLGIRWCMNSFVLLYIWYYLVVIFGVLCNRIKIYVFDLNNN